MATYKVHQERDGLPRVSALHRLGRDRSGVSRVVEYHPFTANEEDICIFNQFSFGGLSWYVEAMSEPALSEDKGGARLSRAGYRATRVFDGQASGWTTGYPESDVGGI